MTDVITNDDVQEYLADAVDVKPATVSAKEPEIVFDLTRLTGEEMMAYIRAESTSNVDKMAIGIAKSCVSIRGHKGKIEPEMFAGLKYAKWHELMKQFRACFLNTQIPQLDMKGFVYDLDLLMARDMAMLKRGVNAMNADLVAKVFCNIFKKVPMGWGSPSKSETWLKRSYFGVMMPLAQAIILDATDGEKNESDSSIFGFQA
ncbi:MAG: hypothetical protein MUF38_05745 [Anaerolineae bacterium]|jgi:hypothetical protein|nr:hypothetical protein [Anaerolineae bacterium]